MTKLSPQQIQLMKLLQIPTMNIDQRIQEEIETNPVLETGDMYEEENFGADAPESPATDEIGENSEADDFLEDVEERLPNEEYELDDYLVDYIEDDPSIYTAKGDTGGGDQEEKTIPIAVENSFHEYLEQQLGLLDLKEKNDILIAKQIIGSIDDDGYLRREISAITDDLLFAQNIEVSEADILSMLEKVQRFDPPGIGARTLQECLLLQIRNKLEFHKLTSDDVFNLRMAARIINDYFDEFSKKHYTKMQRSLNLDEDGLKTAIDEIIKLNPRPATGYASDRERNQQYIVPDFNIENRDGTLELVVDSRNVPDLRISEHYKDLLKSYRNHGGRHSDRMQKEAIMFIKQKIDSAKWFIDAIRQREQTMFRTMYAILQYQYEFFLTGDEKRIRPMILKDIADVTGLDISTVSRVANSKFVCLCQRP